MRRRLAAIIGVAFCAGALTALWADRPWDRPSATEALAARTNDAPWTGASPGAVGTYGAAGGHTDLPPPADAPAGALARTVPTPPPATGAGDAAPLVDLSARRLRIPVQGVHATELQPTFYAQRGNRTHEAIDVLAPKGTPVVAVEDGEIAKLFFSVRGGRTIYQFDRSGRYCYYYAHLDRYASGLAEKQQVKAGQVIGYVGSTGNADEDAPHLHFAIFQLGPDKRWWQGTPIDPYRVLARQ